MQGERKALQRRQNERQFNTELPFWIFFFIYITFGFQCVALGCLLLYMHVIVAIAVTVAIAIIITNHAVVPFKQRQTLLAAFKYESYRSRLQTN